MNTAHPKPSKPQLRELQYAADNQFGLTGHSVPINGLGAKAKRMMMDRMCLYGWFTEYRHGGWEITDRGRAELAKAKEPAV